MIILSISINLAPNLDTIAVGYLTGSLEKLLLWIALNSEGLVSMYMLLEQFVSGGVSYQRGIFLASCGWYRGDCLSLCSRE